MFLEPVITFLLKYCVDISLLSIRKLVNLSLAEAVFFSEIQEGGCYPPHKESIASK